MTSYLFYVLILIRGFELDKMLVEFVRTFVIEFLVDRVRELGH